MISWVFLGTTQIFCLYFILRDLLNNSATAQSTLQCISSCLGGLACVAAQTAARVHPCKLDCSVCDRGDKQLHSATTQLLTFNVWSQCLTLASPSNPPPVIVSFLPSLGSILRHALLDKEKKKAEFFKYFGALITHEDRSVRLAVGDLLKTICFNNGANFFELDDIFKKLKSLEEESDEEKLETLWIIFGKIGCVVEGEYLLVLLLDLLRTMVHQHADIRTIAYEQILLIAKSKGKTTTELITQSEYKEPIVTFIVRELVSLPALLDEICASLLGQCEPTQFLKNFLSIAFPPLLLDPSKDKETKKQIYAELQRRLQSERALIFDYVAEIFCYTLVNYPEQYHTLCQFLLELTSTNYKDIVKNYLSNILNCLVFALGETPKLDKVKKALSIIKDIAEPERVSLADFLGTSGRFLAIIDFVNKKFDTKDMKTKEQLLRGLNELLVLIGQHINSMRPKIMATLELVSKDPGLQGQASEVWLTFIKNLDINTVGHILSKIFVDLLPLSKDPASQQNVVEIFKYLVLENKATLRPYFKEVSFVNMDYMKEIPALRDIVLLLQNETEMGFKDKLKQLIRSIQHENSNVRLSALQKLKEVLREKRGDILQLIVGESVDPIIANMVKYLLLGCRDIMKNSRLACGDCLGELSAIDPGRLDIVLKPEIILGEKEEIELAADLTSRFLVKAFRASMNTAAQDRAAYAIQELLKFCGCSDKALDLVGGTRTPRKTAEQRKANNVWNDFPDDVKDIIAPFLDSTYELKKIDKIPATPIYPQVKTYRDWVARFCYFLMDRATGPKRPLFYACRGVVKDDLDTALHLLPFLLYNVLTTAPDKERHAIKVEFLSVLEASAKGTDNMEMNKLSTQCVFDLHDWLNKWLETQQKLKKSKYKGKKRTQEVDLEYTKIESFMADIPALLLSDASDKCHSYARALLHFECYLREEINRKPTQRNDILQKNIIRLQEIYSKLDEPDGLAGTPVHDVADHVGIAKIRQNTTLKHQILDYENAGKWADALTCYDQALQNPDAESIYGLLNCLRNLGSDSTDTLLTVFQDIWRRCFPW